VPKFVAAIDTSQIPTRGFVPEASATPPASPVVGQMWTDTATGVVKVWNGAAWVRTDGGDLPDGVVTDAKVAANAGIAISKLAVNVLDRANHIGTQAAATISDFDTAVRANRLDQLAAPAAALDLNGQRVTNAAAAVAPTDLVTLQQLDDARAGIAGIKEPVRVATQGNVNIASPGTEIDGVTLDEGDRVLLAGQTVGTENGIYVFNGAAAAMTRAADADAAGEILDGTLVAVAEGTYAGHQYIQTATPSGAPGSWTQVWVVFNTSGTTYLAGDGLVLDGNAFSIVAADGSIEVTADAISVGLVPVAKGGTGGTTAAQARASLGVPGRYTTLLGALAAGVPSNVVHGLGSETPLVTVREVATGAHIELDVETVDANTVSVKADVAFGANALEVTVIG